MSVTWCTKPGGNSIHYFGNGMDAPCECGERPYFQAGEDRQCRYCLAGEMQHERNVLCCITHTPWKNCGEDCCIVSDQPTLPAGFTVCPWCPASGTEFFMQQHMERHEEGVLPKLVPFAQVRDKSILQEIAEERIRQDDKWGEQNHPDGTGEEWTRSLIPFAWKENKAEHIAQLAKWHCQRKANAEKLTFMDIALEEIAEAFAETDPVQLRAELVQASAVLVAWIGAIDRRRTDEIHD